MPSAMRPPTAPESAEPTSGTVSIQPSIDHSTLDVDLLNKNDTLNPNSSRLYQFARNKVIAGNRQPSNNPRSKRRAKSEAALLMKPMHRQQIPQKNVMAGMTRLNCSLLTYIDAGN